MNKEELLDKLRKMLFTTQQANECGLSNNDFKEDIETLSEAIGLIEKQKKELELLSKKIYLCTPEIPQNEHQEYVSYVDLLNKIMKQEKIIDKTWDLYYEYLSIRPASGMHFLKSKGFDVSKCEKCSFDDDNINCKECIKEYFKKVVDEDVKD